MKNNIASKGIILGLGLILIAAISRLIPHPPNFTPLAAIGLFGAAYFANRKLAFIIPLAAWWFSDLLLNNTIYAQYSEGFTLFSSYQIGSFIALALIVLVGFTMLKKVNLKSIFGSSLVAAILFFLISNFGVWLMGTMYPMNISGLMACFAAGVPFFGWTLLGNVVYLSLMVFVFEFAGFKIPSLKLV